MEVSIWERALVERFYGLDIDYPSGMMHLSDGLQYGIRPPTWGFFLSDNWRGKLSLSKEALRTALQHEEIRLADCKHGTWIELGSSPDLYPARDGVPRLPAILNRVLQLIRHRHLDLTGLGQWDGDPNDRFDLRNIRRWLARFDDDSDWPGEHPHRQ